MCMKRISPTTGRVKSQWMSVPFSKLQEGKRGTGTRRKEEKRVRERRKNLEGERNYIAMEWLGVEGEGGLLQKFGKCWSWEGVKSPGGEAEGATQSSQSRCSEQVPALPHFPTVNTGMARRDCSPSFHQPMPFLPCSSPFPSLTPTSKLGW